MAYKLVINGYCSPITISISGGQNTLVVIAKDAANNQSQITHTIIGSLSSTGLALFVNSLPSITSMKDIEIGGLASGNNVVVKINDSPVSTDSNGDFRQLINLSEGVNSIRIFARDSDGNEEEKIFSITCDSIPPILNIIKPIENSLVNSTFIEGTVEDASRVTVQANGLGLTIKNGRFSGGARLLSTGNTQIEIIAKDEAGNETMAVRNVTIDVSSPNIIDIIPIDMTIVNSSSVAIKGKVNDDIAVASVVVNQVLATIDGSGQFTANNVPIIQGPNKIVITATDTVGNKSEQSLILTGKDITPPPLPIVFPVISPTRLSTQTILGRSEPGSIITITGGVSLVSTEAVFGSGLFFANVDLVQGNNVLTITAKDKDQNTSIPAQVQVFSDPNLPLPLIGQPYLINLSTGDTQRGLVNMELPRPLTTIVTDQAGNPLANVPVTYSLSQGDGTFVGGNTIFQTVTDSNGQANARYIAGSSAGVQIIQAGFQGNILSPILFLAEVFDGSLDDPTTVSGIVLDQNLRALPNALIRISGQQARTRGDGRFIISNVSAGPHQLLEVVGRDQISIPGRWPNISYDIDVLPGIDNNLGRPLFLPRVNEGIDIPLDSAGVVTEDTSTELVLKNDKPPIKITARAGTRVIFPPDVTDKRLSVTNIREDRVPMSLEDGLFTSLYISVQPSGAVFDPPLEVTFPNVDLLSANSLVLLMSFDHDAGRYIRVGTGQVSADGQSISSDVGSGIRVGAWHAFPPPAPIPSGSVSANSSNDVCQCEIWAGGQRGINIGMNSTRQFVVPNIPAASSRKVSVQGNCGSCITVQTIELLDMMGNNLEPNPVSYGGGVRIFTDAEMRGGTPKRKIKVK